ncbi:hypothetical protein EJ06DRAFT_341027 [Trichodelitschia bisporula]|uniref:Uncharacterized protein n=1 Tax=Trichodelitschia bisporula TaxID=703511 RepID=A0A6G1I2F4_9PEZI|nr:hypothetical protein EJ06DRAFT_341027 [Trichodelitschia bisporula]
MTSTIPQGERGRCHQSDIRQVKHRHHHHNHHLGPNMIRTLLHIRNIAVHNSQAESTRVSITLCDFAVRVSPKTPALGAAPPPRPMQPAWGPKAPTAWIRDQAAGGERERALGAASNMRRKERRVGWAGKGKGKGRLLMRGELTEKLKEETPPPTPPLNSDASPTPHSLTTKFTKHTVITSILLRTNRIPH